MKIWFKRLLILLLLVGAGLIGASYLIADSPEDLVAGRARLLTSYNFV